MTSFAWTSNTTSTLESFNFGDKLSESWSKLTTVSSNRTIQTMSQNNTFTGWDGVITSEFGTRIFQGREEFHKGIDIAISQGTPLQSNINGKVIASGEASSQGYHDSYGNIVVIQDSYGREHLYGHLDKVSANVGDTVNVGNQIGFVGSTGNSTGSHLHYQINYDGMQIDPSNFVAQAQNGVSNMYTYSPSGYTEVQPLTSAEDVENIKATLDAQEEVGGGLFDGITNFMDFVNTARTEGLSIAIWGKPFDQVVIDGIGAFFSAIFKGIGIFITQNSDLFFLAPAILFLFLTFMVGRNRFTKWVIPLIIFYVCSKALYYFLIGA